MDISTDEPALQVPISLDNLKIEAKQATSELTKELEPLSYVQEKTRSQLAKRLVHGFIGTVVGIFLIIVIDKFFYYTSSDKDKFKEQTGAKDLITLVLTTQSTLVAAAIGFYFGTRDTK
jgi:hypothetical protein